MNLQHHTAGSRTKKKKVCRSSRLLLEGSMDVLYPHRLQGRHIRLLEVGPGSGTDAINCRLREECLDQAPQFEALSYVWGDANDKRDIVCNGQRFMATANLHYALGRLRLESKPRLIWADAVCINQGDIIERAQQVQIMGNIYTVASRVVVSLGVGDEDVFSLGLGVARLIYDACYQYADSQGKDVYFFAIQDEPFRDVRLESIEEEVNKNKDGGASWKALAHILSMQWFTRVWCVQEILLARESLVLIGRQSVSWEVLGVSSAWLNGQNIASDFNLPSHMSAVPYNNCFCMFDEVIRFDDPSNTLVALLRKFHEFNSTDPRDKVYGLLGIVPNPGERQTLIEVDYEKSVAQVYTDVAEACIRREAGLSVLSYVQHGSELGGNSGIPSWVPVWNATSAMTLGSLPSAWNTCGPDHELPDFQILDKGTLVVRGVLYDEVESVRPVMDASHFQPGNESDQQALLDLWDEITAVREEGVNQVILMTSTLTAGLNTRWDYVELLDEEDREQAVNDFVEYVNHLLETTGKDTKKIHYDFGFVLEEDNDWTSFRLAASRVCDGRRVFQVAGGKYGLGPACMAKGDLIVVFKGGIVPFVVRPREDGTFALLGDCYIVEIMRGEVFEEELLERPVPTEQAFSLK